jgi:hypothetical protein
VSEARVHGQHAEVLHDQIPAASGAFAAGAARVHAVYVEVLRSQPWDSGPRVNHAGVHVLWLPGNDGPRGGHGFWWA